MRIGFDGTPLLGQRSGVGNYTGRLLAALIESNPEWEYLLYSNRPLDPLEPELSPARPIYSSLAKKRLLWMHMFLPAVIQRSQPNLCHFPNAMAPLWQQKPFILTIHDASLFYDSVYHPLARVLSIRLALPIVVRRASAIITVSNHARDDLIRTLNLDPEKVHVVYEAAPRTFRPVTDPGRLETLKRKYHLPEQFILYVGTMEPRKNLIRLLNAYARIRARGYPHKLVLTGENGRSARGLLAEIERLSLQEEVLLTGYVAAGDLPGLYTLATLFAFPSLFEGFGLPPLEAMACGTPVLASNRTALPEICANAAFYVDPEDEEAIADGLVTLLDDPDCREVLSQRGLARAREFSWEQAAQETAAVYRQILNGHNG